MATNGFVFDYDFPALKKKNILSLKNLMYFLYNIFLSLTACFSYARIFFLVFPIFFNCL